MNPMNWVGDPDMAPGTGHGMWGLFALALAAYALAFWLVFKGPLRQWAQDNQGGAYLVLAFGPMLVMFAAILIV